ncbi:hypothetical protein MKX01_016743 [Papaver californicum]|nr:hypothetical protein MKX01_016743 [Papaver californicum]
MSEISQLVNAEDDVDSNTTPDAADQCLDALLSGAVDMDNKLLSSYLLLWAEVLLVFNENERAESKKRFEKCSRKKLLLFSLWKALKIAGKRKPHKNLLDAEDEKVKRALTYVLEIFDGNWREGSSRR